MSLAAEGWEVTMAQTRGPTVLYDRTLGAMVTVDAGQVRRVDMPFQRLPTGPGITGDITGGWPEGALLTMLDDGENVTHFFRRTRGGWEPQRLTAYFRKGHDSSRGYLLAGPYWPSIGAAVVPGDDDRSTVFVTHTEAERPLFSFGGDGTPRLLGNILLDDPRQFVTPPTGEIVVLGQKNAKEYGRYRWAVEQWRAGDAAHVTVEMPGRPASEDASELDVVMCSTAGGTVHLLRQEHGSTKGALLTLHGATWDVNEIPGQWKRGPRSCAVGRDGSIWYLADDGVYRLPGAGVVERAPYPALPPLARRTRFQSDGSGPVRPVIEEVPPDRQVPDAFVATEIVVSDGGGVWIAGVRWKDGHAVSTDGEPRFLRRAVLRVGPPLPGTPIDWDTVAPGVIEARLAAYNAQQSRNSVDDLSERLEPSCDGFFVRVISLPKSGPLDAEIAAVRAVVAGRADLAGAHFVEAWIDGVSVLGALVPDQKLGQRILGLLKGKVPGKGARLYCGRAHVVRAIPIGVPRE